jgi:hypothetical protein
LHLLEDDLLLREGDSESENNMELDFLLAGDDDGDVTFNGFGGCHDSAADSSVGGGGGVTTRAACVSACTVPVTADGEEEDEDLTQLLTYVLDVPAPVRSVSTTSAGPFANNNNNRPFSPLGAQMTKISSGSGTSRSTPLFGSDAASPFKKRKQKR